MRINSHINLHHLNYIHNFKLLNEDEEKVYPARGKKDPSEKLLTDETCEYFLPPFYLSE